MLKSNKTRIRNSNIELLRIVSMIIIVAHHYVVHGVMMNYAVWARGSSFNRIFSAFLIPGGQVGVAVFFMISGFFLIRKSVVNFRGLLRIVLECAFYGWLSLVIFIAAYIANYRIPNIATKDLIYLVVRSIFLPASSGLWWFVSAYILLVLFSSIINMFLNNLSKRGLIYALAVQWIFYYIIGSLGSYYFDLYKAIFFYSIGATYYLAKKRSAGGGKTSNQKKILSIICFIIGWCIASGCGYEQAVASLQDGLSGDLMVKLFALIQMAITTPICAFSLFYIFDNLKITPSKKINKVASTTFGIYLFHDADLISNLLWNKWLRVDSIQYSSHFFALCCVVTVFTVFVLLSFLDLLRQRIEPMVMKRVISARNTFIEKYTA